MVTGLGLGVIVSQISSSDRFAALSFFPLVSSLLQSGVFYHGNLVKAFRDELVSAQYSRGQIFISCHPAVSWSWSPPPILVTHTYHPHQWFEMALTRGGYHRPFVPLTLTRTLRHFWNDSWNVFDTLVVSVSFVEALPN